MAIAGTIDPPVQSPRRWPWLVGVTATILMMALGISWHFSVNPGTVSIPGQEQRCTDLGANCICSETMDGPETAVSGIPPLDHDFVSSPDAKECWGDRSGTQTNGFGVLNGASDYGMELASATAGGWADVTWTLRGGTTSNFWLRPVNIITGDLAFDSSDRVSCIRYYTQIESSYTNSGNSGGTNNCTCSQCPRNKLMQMNFVGSNDGNQFQERADGNGCPTPRTSNYNDIVLTLPTQPHQEGGGNGNKNLSPAANLADCKDAPCRIEMCVDGNLTAGTDIVYRVQVHSIDTDTTSEYTSIEGDVSGGPTNLTTYGGDMFHDDQNVGNGEGNWNAAHFMEARWQTDSNQWIGCAKEIEGADCQ